jgi:2-oxoglutarate ferredoxin oxidoreductase subunit alpha
MVDNVTWKIGGEAGFGIMSAGNVLAKTFTRAGFHIFAVNDYPSLIRGGHNVVSVRIGSTPFSGINRDLHILVALNAETVTIHKDELNPGALVLFDPSEKEWTPADFPVEVVLMPVPLKEIVTSLKADLVMRNTVVLGASVALLGAPFEALFSVIHDQFIHKGQEVVDQNEKIARAGYDYIKEHFAGMTSMHLSPGTITEKQLVINGSEAVGLGAIKAGLKFAAIYPMTPINAIISFLADHAKELGVVYKQPEDEIAGITMAIGASVAGVRSMVATSGGGFALMVEGLSLAGMIEVPLVIDLGMRVGPATGMPTYTEQGELLFAVHAGHGEFARIILAPGDAEEAYHLTIDAFQLADKYQVPVFVLTDKYLNESQWCMKLSHFQKPVVIDRGKLIFGDTGKPEGTFERYDTSVTDGVSPRSVPGTKNGQYYANSYEHDGTGHVTDNAEKRRAMVEKRLRKVQSIEAVVPPPVTYGDTDAEVLLVTWGTTKGAVISAMEALRSQGKKVGVVTFPWIYPFPVAATKELLAKAKRTIVIEQNATGQLAWLIRAETGIDIAEKFIKYDGRPWLPEELLEKLQ